jgi:hypothetical protein
MSDKDNCLHVWRGRRKLSLNWFKGKNTNHVLKDLDSYFTNIFEE